MLGSVKFDDPSIDGQVNVALALRQPGSTLKPFTYVTAFGKGWNPATLLWDIPTTFPGGYKPNDFDDKFPGPMTVRDALAQSRNIPAVEALQFVSVPEMLATAHRFGITDLRQPDRYGLSVTLGGGEVKLLDLTYAYAAFANGGQQAGAEVPADAREPGFRQFNPVSILKVTNSSGKVLYEYKPKGTQVEDPRLAYQITSILSDDKARQPTYGANSPLVLPGRPAAVKTGSTDEYRDSWVVGYTPDLVTGVWVGNSNNSPMKDVLGVAGAGQIWHDFMAGALEGAPVIEFKPPQGVQQAEVCALSGMLPTQECRENTLPIHGIRQDWFVPGINLPTKPDDWHQRVDVCKLNGKRSTPLVPDNARDSLVYVTLPEADRAWGAAHGYPTPPSEDCSDIYQGERLAQILGPTGSDRITVGQTVQIVGSAYIDDFSNYTLDVGPGDNPTSGRRSPTSGRRRSTRPCSGCGTPPASSPAATTCVCGSSTVFKTRRNRRRSWSNVSAPGHADPAVSAARLRCQRHPLGPDRPTHRQHLNDASPSPYSQYRRRDDDCVSGLHPPGLCVSTSGDQWPSIKVFRVEVAERAVFQRRKDCLPRRELVSSRLIGRARI